MEGTYWHPGTAGVNRQARGLHAAPYFRASHAIGAIRRWGTGGHQWADTHHLVAPWMLSVHGQRGTVPAAAHILRRVPRVPGGGHSGHGKTLSTCEGAAHI